MKFVLKIYDKINFKISNMAACVNRSFKIRNQWQNRYHQNYTTLLLIISFSFIPLMIVKYTCMEEMLILIIYLRVWRCFKTFCQMGNTILNTQYSYCNHDGMTSGLHLLELQQQTDTPKRLVI